VIEAAQARICWICQRQEFVAILNYARFPVEKFHRDTNLIVY
jgi:hypothetical protein